MELGDVLGAARLLVCMDLSMKQCRRGGWGWAWKAKGTTHRWVGWNTGWKCVSTDPEVCGAAEAVCIVGIVLH